MDQVGSGLLTGLGVGCAAGWTGCNDGMTGRTSSRTVVVPRVSLGAFGPLERVGLEID